MFQRGNFSADFLWKAANVFKFGTFHQLICMKFGGTAFNRIMLTLRLVAQHLNFFKKKVCELVIQYLGY